MAESVNKKMTKCRTCGAEIAKSAKVCPHCGAKNAKPIGCFTGGLIALLTLLIIGMIIAMFSGSSDKTNKNTSESTTQTEEPEVPAFEPVTQNIGRWEITITDFNFVDAVKAGWLTQYSSEKDSKYAVVNATVVNNGKDEAVFLPAISLGNDINCEIRYKDYTYKCNSMFFSKNDLCNTSLNPLETSAGEIAFPMPDAVIEDTETPLKLVFTLNGKTISFNLR